MDEGTRLRSTIWKFIRPATEEMLFYSFVALCIFGVAWYQSGIAGHLNLDTKVLLTLLHDAVTSSTETIGIAIGNNKLILFGFWFVVGTFVYMIAWFFVSIALDLYNDIVISAAFVHPKSFRQSDYWGAIAAHTLLRGSAAFVLAAYIYFWLRVLLPVWRNSFIASLDGITIANGINAALTFVVIVLSLHICTILFRIIRPNAM